MQQLPALAVLTVVSGGLVLGAALDWQLGAVVLGLGLLLGGVLRLGLPARSAGWLAVRARGLDAAVLVGLGLALVVLAQTIPDA